METNTELFNIINKYQEHEKTFAAYFEEIKTLEDFHLSEPFKKNDVITFDLIGKRIDLILSLHINKETTIIDGKIDSFHIKYNLNDNKTEKTLLCSFIINGDNIGSFTDNKYVDFHTNEIKSRTHKMLSLIAKKLFINEGLIKQ